LPLLVDWEEKIFSMHPNTHVCIVFDVRGTADSLCADLVSTSMWDSKLLVCTAFQSQRNAAGR